MPALEDLGPEELERRLITPARPVPAATHHGKQRLQVNNGPDVHFVGRVCYQYSSQNKDSTRDRWTELRLWESEGGAWIAESTGFSSRSGEAALRDVLIIEPTEAELDMTGAEAAKSLADWQNRVMDFFGWTIVAKAFAKAAGWDVIRRVP